jgi:hypothetical protein
MERAEAEQLFAAIEKVVANNARAEAWRLVQAYAEQRWLGADPEEAARTTIKYATNRREVEE